jgi:hypothetical protein
MIRPIFEEKELLFMLDLSSFRIVYNQNGVPVSDLYADADNEAPYPLDKGSSCGNVPTQRAGSICTSLNDRIASPFV